MTFVVMFFLLIAASVLQTLLPGVVALGNAKAPLLLSVVVYYGLNRGAAVAIVAAFLAGFLQDALSGVPLGYSSFCFCVAVWGIGRFRDTVLSEAGVTQVFFGAVSGVAVALLLYVLLVRGQRIGFSARSAFAHAAGSGALGALAAPCVCLLAGRLDRLVGNVRSPEVEVQIGGLGRTSQR